MSTRILRHFFSTGLGTAPQGNVVGMEILDASKRVDRPSIVEQSLAGRMG